MKILINVHCTKLCILSLLLLVWGALLPAYACPPEVDKAVAQLQKSARAKISADNWLAQVIDKTSDDIVGTKIAQEKLWAALFPDRQSLVYLKKYLAEVKIRQNDNRDELFPRVFLFNQITYTYSHTYPFSVSQGDRSKSACQFSVGLYYNFPAKGWFEGKGFLYYFDLKNGKMKLIGSSGAG